MAINFLNTVNLNKNQLIQTAIENLGTDPATGVVGQIYYNTSDSALKICITANIIGPPVVNAVWQEVGATSGVETISIGNANVNAGGVNTGLVRTPGTGIGDVVITPAIYGGAANVGMVPTLGTGTTFLRGDATWQTVDNYVSWTADSDEGTDITVTSGFNLKFTGAITGGGAGIATDSAISANEMTIGLINTGGTPSATTFYRGDGQWIVPTDTGITSVVNVIGTSSGTPLDNAIVNRVLTLTSNEYAGGAFVGYVPKDGLVNQYLDGTGAWVDVTTGDIESVTESLINNRLGIRITTPTGPDPVVGLDIIGQTNLGTTPATDDELIIYDTSTTTNKSITVENLVGGYETTYDLTTAPTGTAVRLTSSDAGDPAEDVTISGTAGRTAISRISTTELRVDLTDDVTIINDLTVSGVITQVQTGETNTFSSPLDMGGSTASVTPNKILNVATGTAATDGVNLGQVELLVAGVGVFQGGYNATTGLTVPGGGELDGTSNIALDKGDYFVVTTAGTAFFGLSLEPGDFIFAETAIAANSNPPVGDYIVVRADDNVAGAGATDGATQKGVSGFDSENFTVSSNGWVQLKPLANPYGAKVALTGGDNATAGQTTFTVDVTALFGATADARNCKIEVLKDAGDLTVYPEVTRNGTGDVLLEFMPQVGNSLYSALITIV